MSGGTAGGGLTAENSESAISYSYATGQVDGTSYVGGLIGRNLGSVDNSYATGAASGTMDLAYVGGLVGDNFGALASTTANGAFSGPHRLSLRRRYRR